MTVALAACSSGPVSSAGAASKGSKGHQMSRHQAMNYLGAEKNLYACAVAEGGQVNFYTSETDSNTLIKQAFEKAYPKVNLNVTLATATLDPTIEQQYAAGKHTMDVYGNSNGLVRDGTYFTKFKSPDSKLLRAGLSNPYFLGYSGYVEAVGYNPTIIKPGTITTTWKSLLNPSLKGKLYFSTDAASPFLVAMLKSQFGLTFLKKLASNVRVSGANGSAVASQIAAGTVGAGIDEATAYTARTTTYPSSSYRAQIMKPMLAGYFMASIARFAPHPCAARLLVDWLASPKGGVPVNLKLGNASPLTNGKLQDITVPFAPPENQWKIITMTNPVLYKGFKSQPAAIAKFNTLFQSIFVQGGGS